MPALYRVYLGVLFSILVFFLFPTKIFSYFQEEFSGNSLDPSSWISYNNSGTIIVENGVVKLNRSNIPSNTFPYVKSTDKIFPQEGSFNIDIKYRFLSTGRFGDGITISAEATPNNGIDPGSNLYSYMVFMAYQDKTSGLSFGKIICDENGLNCSNRQFLKPFNYTEDLNYHVFRINYSAEGQYSIFLENDTQPAYVSSKNQRRPKYIWFGNSLQTSTTDLWSSLEIDYIKVNTDSLPKTINPVIILPGFGGSWDMPALLTGTPGSDWQIPDYVKVYDGLFNSLKNAGLKENEDLFIFPYDWRKRIDILADDLKSFIDSHNLADKQINLVGHSMGGLVARAFAQKYPDSKINKIVTAGTPNNGTLDAYGLWEGATFWGNIWWEKTLVALTTELNKTYAETKIDTLRRVAPSIQDILPTSDFLYFSGILKPWNSLVQKNLFLDNLNNNGSALASKLTPIWSGDEDTRSRINTGNRNFYDGMMGLWEDGKPLEQNTFTYEKGDGTVTGQSAKGIFSQNAIQGSGNHIGLISQEINIKKILDILGLESSAVVESYQTYPSNAFVAVLRSPGSLEVCNESGKCNAEIGLYYPQYKLFILPGYTEENLRIHVYENGFGKYTLHTGNIDEQSLWDSTTGNLQKLGQIDSYLYTKGEIDPTDKNQCIDRKWQLFVHAKFKNQGQCVSYVENYLNRIKKHHLFEFDNRWLAKRFPHRR